MILENYTQIKPIKMQEIEIKTTKVTSSIKIKDKKPAKLSFIEYLISMPKCDELDIQRVEGKAREIEFE